MNGPSRPSETEIIARVRSAILSELTDLRSAIMVELGKLARKQDELHQAVNRVAERQFEREHDEARYRRRLKGAEEELERISKQVDGPDWRRDPREITGVHHLHEVVEWKKDEEKRRRDSGIWWQRQRWLWAMAILGALLVMTIGGCATYALVGLRGGLVPPPHNTRTP